MNHLYDKTTPSFATTSLLDKDDSPDLRAKTRSRKRVVVVGAGFGGLNAVQALAKVDVDILLIDRTNHHLFQPLLYQTATAALASSDIASATRAILRSQANATVIIGEVTGVDAACGVVAVRDTGEIGFDYLVLATGAAYDWFGHDDWARHATVLKTLEDAEMIRLHLLTAFDWAESRSDPKEIERLLTFVIVGGGPTGVELSGAIAELARSTLARDYRHINPASARIVLCETGPRLLATFPEDLSSYTAYALRRLGVDVRLCTHVETIDGCGIVANSDRIDSASVFWCAGTKARPAAVWLGADAARNGAVVVEPDCSVPGHPNIFAIGDVSSFVEHGKRPLPSLAPVAKQQGRYVARVIASRLAGRDAPAGFAYRNYGTMAVIGRSKAVADFGRLHLCGYVAWAAWSLVHLLLLVGFRNRIMVYVNWAWAWFTYRRGARLATGIDRLLEKLAGKGKQADVKADSERQSSANAG